MLWRNWGRTEWARPRQALAPGSPADVARAVAAAAVAGRRIKVVGSGHSFSGIAVPESCLLSLEHLRGILAIDQARHQVTVAAGTSLRELNAALDAFGLALANLGDIDQQTLAGALATGTHGTGLRHGGLATQVVALELVTAAGEILQCSAAENAEVFAAARIGLGALGVITALTLQCVAAFDLHAVEDPAPLAEVLDDFERLAAANDHFEFYWFPHGERVLTKKNNRVAAATVRRPLGAVRAFVDDELLSNGVFAATNRLGQLLPATIPPVNRLATRLLAARTYVDVSHRVFVSPRRVRFREMEYALPLDGARAAFERIRSWIDSSGERISFPLEIRVAAADDVWLSTAHGRVTAYVAVHTYFRTDHRRFFAAAEAILWAAGGRPHWGKIHTRGAAELRGRYPRFDDFLEVRRQLDPTGLFVNAYLQRVLGPSAAVRC